MGKKGRKQQQSLKLVHKDEEIDRVIEEGKKILAQLHFDTFHRYREVGQIVIASGYKKRKWHSRHRQKALEEWAISHRTFNYMVELGEMTDEEFRNVVAKFPSVHAWANRPREKLETPPMPEGPFDVFYADPPWKYEVNYLSASPDSHYPTMTTEEICKLQIPETYSENAVLFLWATNPMLEDALKVMKAWGFQYKTNMVWVKHKFGLGFWFRGQHELLLVGVKGNVHHPEESSRFPSVLHAPIKGHSEKPDETYNIIEAMYPNARKIELFARKKREGWTAWGLEVQESG